jgi:hypothetical protein
MEALYSSETLLSIYESIRRYKPDDQIRQKNLTSSDWVYIRKLYPSDYDDSLYVAGVCLHTNNMTDVRCVPLTSRLPPCKSVVRPCRINHSFLFNADCFCAGNTTTKTNWMKSIHCFMPNLLSISPTKLTILIICGFFYDAVISPHYPSNGVTAQIGPWPPLLRFHNNNVLRCEVVSLTTNPH